MYMDGMRALFKWGISPRVYGQKNEGCVQVRKRLSCNDGKWPAHMEGFWIW